MAIDEDGLAFFNSLSGRLDIQLTESPSPITDSLYNLAAPPTARIASVELRLDAFEEDKGDFRPLTEDEWNRVAFRDSTIQLRGAGERVVEHRASNGRWFSTRELAKAIEETERQTRGYSNWFGGIDVHHVFFQGIELGDDGVWSTSWGS
jgi:hypothetical protein